ncbi:MAG TPA: helix-turn-helix domain-containing protein [Candidatus Cloacimonadota bacterium]|jgi:sugar-specific transcriptional regulator TrmB|nr:helix-turn-helix domain-containing protein [Candidatus Cloacimonadota bacterium]
MDLIRKLADLGFTETEASIYIHLLKNNSCTATEIAKSVGISRTQSYQIIENLIHNNMCIEQLGSVKKYSAVDPAKVSMLIEKDLEDKKQILSSLKPVLMNLYHEDKQNENPFDFIKVLYTKSSIVQTIEDLEKNASECVLAFNKPPYVMNLNIMNENEISMEVRSSERDSINKGVSFKSLYEIEDNDLFIKKIEYFERMGETVRVLPKLPFKMFIFDSKIITIALQNKMSSGVKFVTLLIEHSDFAESLEEIFDIYWESAMTLDAFKNRGQKDVKQATSLLNNLS